MALPAADSPGRIAHALCTRRYIWLTLSLLAVCLLTPGILSLGFDTRLSALLGDRDPYVAEHDWLNDRFPGHQEISIAVVAAHGPTDVFSPEILNALGEMHFAYRRIPWAQRANSVVAYESPTSEIGLVPGRFQRFEELSPEQRQAARDKAMADRFINGVLVSPEADLARFVITLELSESTSEQNRQINEALQSLLEELQQSHPNVRFYPSAEAILEQSTRLAMINDLTQLLPLVILSCVALLCFYFRSIRYGMAVLAITLLTALATLGTLGRFAYAFNSISVMAPLVTVIIAVANTAHILSVYRQQLGAGVSRAAAMLNSVHWNLKPVSLAALTTAIGFASLNYASAPAISDFGSIVALGIVYAWVLSFAVFPALVLLMPGSPGKVASIQRFLTFCRTLTAQQDKWVFTTVIAAGILSAALLFLNETDFNRLDFIDEDSSVHDYYELMSTRMQRGGTLVYGLALTGNDGQAVEGGAIQADFLNTVDDLSQWIRQQQGISDVVSLVEVVKTINQTLAGSRAQYRLPLGADDESDPNYVIPDKVADIRNHLQNYVTVQRDTYALDNFVDEHFSTIRLFINTYPLSNQQIIDLDRSIGRYFNAQYGDSAVTLVRGSTALLFARMDESVTVELIHSYLISLLVITLALSLGLRSLPYGILSVIPNLLPATLVFGAWGLFVGRLDPFVMMLFSVSIGLVVDDTVHILNSYKRRRREGLPPEMAVNDAVEHTGPALTMTTIVLALGTLILLLANTLYFQQAARLLVPIVVIALLLDLIFLPGLLVRIERRWPGWLRP